MGSSPVASEAGVKLGSLLADIGREARLTDKEFAAFENVRDKTPLTSSAHKPVHS